METETQDMLSLSKGEKIRAIILLISALITGIFGTLTFVHLHDIIFYFYVTIFVGSLGPTIISFWTLMKGKKYDIKL